MSPAILLRRRSPSPSRRLDSDRALLLRRRLHHRFPSPPSRMASALPDDILLAVFSRLPPSAAAVVRCAAVCRHWRRLISDTAFLRRLRSPPPPLGFFHHHPLSPLPTFFPTASTNLDLSLIPVSPKCGVLLADCRGERLLLRDLRNHSQELDLVVCNPLSRASLRLPSIYAAGHCLDTCALIPGEGSGFRVVVVLFAVSHFDILIFSSGSSDWVAASGRLNYPLKARLGPSVLVGDVLYKMQGDDNYILVVNADTMQLSVVSTPAGVPRLHAGNHWIGKTEEGKLCFFALRKPLSLLMWVLEEPGKWAARGTIELGALLDPAMVGELASMKLSAHIADQLHGCKLVSINGFCEGSGLLFLAMADRVVSFDLKTRRMKKLWHNTDQVYPTGDIYPYEMAWPPVLRDLK